MKKTKISFEKSWKIVWKILLIIYIIIFIKYNLDFIPSKKVISNPIGTTTIYSNTKKEIPTDYTYESYYTSIGLEIDSNRTIYLITSWDEAMEKYDYLSQNIDYVKQISINERQYDKFKAIDYFNKDFFKENNLILLIYSDGYTGFSTNISSVMENGKEVKINMKEIEHRDGELLLFSETIHYIPVSKNVDTVNMDIYYNMCFSKSDFTLMFKDFLKVTANIMFLFIIFVLIVTIYDKIINYRSNNTKI